MTRFLPYVTALLMMFVVFPCQADDNSDYLVAKREAFREKYTKSIVAQGWKYFGNGALFKTAGNDWFIRDIRIRKGNIRSAWVLMSFYEKSIPWSTDTTPASQSTKLQFWVNCADSGAQIRDAGKYSDPVGLGLQVTHAISLPNSQPAEFKDPQPGSLTEAVLKAICSEHLK